MNIDINICRINIKVNEVRHLFTSRNEIFVSIDHRLMKIRMPHVTPVHKKELTCPFFTCSFGLPDKAMYLYHTGFNIERQQILVQLLSEHSHNTLTQLDSRKIQHFRIIVMKRKRNLRVDQSDTLKFSQNITQLRLIRFQELTACRYIEE